MPKFISEFKEGEIVDFPTNRKYEFVRALKSGGTGKTILMQDTMLNKFFVCKKYSPMQKQYEKEFYNRFIDEIKIMYAIYDINIVRIFDYYLFPEHSTGYIIMEYVEGKNIDEYFKEEDTDKINSIFVQLINAFAYLEKNNILHRDVRPENVLIDDSGTVKLIDFGFGKNVNEVGNEENSIYLNWPVSQKPEELYSGVYNSQTEIFFVGYLIKNLLAKYEMNSFKYTELLRKMIEISPQKRINSFLTIQDEISNQAMETFDFSREQKNIYRTFAEDLKNSISVIKDSLIVEKDIGIIIEKMKKVLRDNALEMYISNNYVLISCFIKSNYTYYTGKEIPVVEVKNFYNFLVSQSSENREIILNNLYGRLNKIPVVNSMYDEELPFN